MAQPWRGEPGPRGRPSAPREGEAPRPRRSGPIELQRGDVIQLRKPHACGANEWEVVRLGADIGLRCRGCAHRILLPRSDLERRLTSFIHRTPRVEPPGDLDLPQSD